MNRLTLIRTVVIVAFFGLLEILCRTGIISPFTMIPPSEMAVELWLLIASGEVARGMRQTLGNVAVACFFAITVGFAVGAGVHAVPRLRRALDPFLTTYYAVPFFVFYPLLVFIFGMNNFPMIMIGFLFAVVAMIINTLNGLDKIPRVYRKVARMHHMGRTKTALLIELPYAIPNLFTGVKLAVAYSFIGVIAAEFILAPGGLGYAISFAYDNFDNNTMYALMLFILVLVTIINMSLHAYERRLLRRQGR
ncbi:MAG: ABC transporter permease [Salinarimonas sp.]|nr:ABC transporter permease [Salinarimonas sp.]